MIDEVWLPSAIRFGIPVDVFWTLNPKYMYVYQEDYMRRKKEEMQLLDVSAYYQGIYTMRAVSACLSKKASYPKQPLSLQKSEKPLSQEERFKLWVDEFNRRFEDKNKD